MKTILYIFLVLVLFSINPYHSFSQKLNRLNKHGERTGKWITYIDDAKKIKSLSLRLAGQQLLLNLAKEPVRKNSNCISTS
jgi:hypothetical protein